MATWGRIWLGWGLQTPGLGFADTSVTPLADSRSWLSLSYLLSLEAGGECFMSLVICLSLVLQLLLHIWMDCSQITCSQLSWGVCTTLSFSHHVFLACPLPLTHALFAVGWHNLFWPYRLLSETQSLSSSVLDLLLYSQPSTCNFAAFAWSTLILSPPQQCCKFPQSPDPQPITPLAEFCSFSLSMLLLVLQVQAILCKKWILAIK